MKRIAALTIFSLSILFSSLPGQVRAADPAPAEEVYADDSEYEGTEEIDPGEKLYEESSVLPEEPEEEAGEEQAETIEEEPDSSGEEMLENIEENDAVEEVPAEPEEERYEEEFIYINPLYRNIITEADLKDVSEVHSGRKRSPSAQAKDSSEAPADSFSSAGNVVRESMIGREESVSVLLDRNAEAFSGLGYEELYMGIFQQALKESQDGRGGDYLRFHYSGFRVSLAIDGDILEIEFTITYMTSAAQEMQVDSRLSQVMDSLDLGGAGSDAQKVLRIYSYLTDNVVYDYANLDNDDYTLKYTAYAALLNGTSVCQGYASLFYRMCKEAGISARVIAGTGITDTGSEGHAWNIVRVGNIYYNLDATWDSGSEVRQYRWFLKGEDSFDRHVRASENVGNILDYTAAEFYAEYPMSSSDYLLEEDVAIVLQPESVTAAAGEQVTLHIETEGPVTGYRWQWKQEGGSWADCTSAGADTDTFTFKMRALFSGRLYRCVVSGSENTVVSDEARVSIPLPPLAVILQPESVEAEEGQIVRLHIEANRTDVTYQWQWSKDGETWTDCTSSGCNTSTFSFRMKLALADRIYRCIVSADGTSVISDGAQITLVGPPLEITLHPADVSAEAGEKVSLHVEVNKAGASYQWQYSKNGTSWTNCTSGGYKTDTFTFVMKASLAGRTYRCIVSFGNESIASDGAVITFVDPLKLTAEPEDVSVASGERVSLHVAANKKDAAYQWQYSKDGTSWTNCTSGGCRTDTFAFVMKAMIDGRTYRCVVTSGNETVISRGAVMTLDEPLEITEQPESVEALAGERVTLHVSVNIAGAAYQWQYSKNGTTWTNCTSGGCKTDTFGFSMKENLNGRHYRCVVSYRTQTVYTEDALIVLVPDAETVIDGVVYKLIGGAMTVTGYRGNAEIVVVQEIVDGFAVTVIGESAFEGNTVIREIDLPDTIQIIKKRAFAGCTNLTKMY